MRFKCPGCQNKIELQAFQAGQRVVCPYCQMALKAPNVTTLAVPDPAPPPSSLPVPVPPAPPPVYQRPAPAPAPAFTWDDLDEIREDRRESREDRAQDRRERTEDRHDRRIDRDEFRRSNPSGMTGFACCTAAFLMMLGGLIFRTESSAYFCLTTTFSFPIALVGLISSLVGLGTRREANKTFAIIGAILGGLLLLIILPLAVMSLQQDKKW